MTTQAPQAAPNLCQQIYSLIANERFDEATSLLDKHLTTDPLSNKGLLGWTRLQCAQGSTSLAIERLSPPIKQFPENPYYQLAYLEILLTKKQLEQSALPGMYEAVARRAGEAAADIYAKIAQSLIVQELWSYGLPYLLKSIKLTANADPHHQSQNLILLYKRNEAPLAKCMNEVRIMDYCSGQRDHNELSSIPLELIGRVLCILITANELGIPEAAPIISRVATQHSQLHQCSYKQLLNLAIRYSPGWIGLQLPYEFSKPIIHWN